MRIRQIQRGYSTPQACVTGSPLGAIVTSRGSTPSIPSPGLTPYRRQNPKAINARMCLASLGRQVRCIAPSIWMCLWLGNQPPQFPQSPVLDNRYDRRQIVNSILYLRLELLGKERFAWVAGIKQEQFNSAAIGYISCIASIRPTVANRSLKGFAQQKVREASQRHNSVGRRKK